MPKPIEYVINFPRSFPSAYSGVLLPDNETIITGHVNGTVVIWNIKTKKHEIILRFDSIVQTVSNWGNKKIAIGYNSGGLYIYNLESKKITTIQEPTYHVNQRVWKTKWIDENNLIMTSTYGEIRLIKFISENKWSEYPLRISNQTVFALSKYDTRFLTGDYRGNITIWETEEESYIPKVKIRLNGTIQGLYWHNDKCIVAINKNGKLFLVEKTDTEESWQISTEIDIAKDRGTCIILTYDGEIIYAGTNSEIIQFDVSTNQIRVMDLRNVKELFIKKDNIFALTSYALIKFDKERTKIPDNIISYKFKKISLLGHTGTGKSTLCNLLITGKVDGIYSTYGKRVWNYPVDIDEGEYEKRIVLHDHGGQETVLNTFLPFVNDSDIFMLFYSQIDKTTFNRAYELLKGLRKDLGDDIEIYFVQTFIDHDLDDVPHAVIYELVENGTVNDVIKISPFKKDIDDFFAKIVDTIDWNDSKIMISSPFIEGINQAINTLRLRNTNTITLDDFKIFYQKLIGKTISDGHLKYLLNDATNEGIIEYYPDILDIIILNDEEFNKMRTEIPILVGHNNGIIEIRTLIDRFKNTDYIRILDEIYTNSKISYKFQENRVFPHKLKKGNIDIPRKYKEELSKVEEINIVLNYTDINVSQLLDSFSEIRLQCIDMSIKDGLFNWSDNAYIYYNIQERGSSVSGKKIYFTHYVSGKKPETVERLKTIFISIIEKLFGPIQEIVITEKEAAKKKEYKIKYNFDVCLSFAGEQREFVKEVAYILESKGIKVFYDEFFQSQLWGKNLIEYFKEVYYSKSKYCIMFISKEYLEKMWPTHERKNATARDLEEFGEYILPVVFKRDLDVPGLDKYRGYLGVWKYSTDDIANIFIEKLESD